MNKGTGPIDFIRQNWAIIVFLGMFIAGYAALNAKVNAMDAKLAQYPSEDYFELKFQTIEKDIANLGGLLKNHIEQ